MAVFRVRAAEVSDADELVRLEGQARSALVGVRGGDAVLREQPAVGDASAWISALSDQHRGVWVAVIDQVPVGYLEAALPRSPGGTGHVRQVFVEPGAREVGFGDELLAAAFEAIVRAGGESIESWALPGDRDTKNLFERAGVTARKLIVSRQLVDRDTSS